MRNKYKLSICIPTYNRAEYLIQLLDSIFSQPGCEKVEVVISDNASTDNTEELMKRYKENYSNFIYQKLPENKGPDRNFFNAVNIASGEYCWLVGSDDKLSHSALFQILQAIESGKDIYLQDRIECDVNMVEIKRRSWWKTNTKLSWDFKVDDIEDYFHICLSIGGVFSYLSSIVFKRSSWYKFIPPEKYYSTAYSHVYPLLSILKNGGELEIILNSGVLCRSGNDFFANEGLCKRVLIDLKGYTMLSLDLKEEKLKSILKREHSYKNLSLLYDGCLNKNQANACLRDICIYEVIIKLVPLLSFARGVKKIISHVVPK